MENQLHNEYVSYLAFSGELIISVSLDNTIKISEQLTLIAVGGGSLKERLRDTKLVTV